MRKAAPPAGAALAVVLVMGLSTPARAETSRAPSPHDAPRAAPEAGRAGKIAPLAGRYRFVGGKAEVAALEAAIEDVVGGMNVLVRGTARRRLAESAAIPAGLSLSLKNEMLTVRLPDAAYAAPLDGSRVMVEGPAGDPIALRHQVLGDAKLRQLFDADDGWRVNTCERLENGRLRIHVTIHSPKLPKNLDYAITFAKAS
jgi:hypothetical protein